MNDVPRSDRPPVIPRARIYTVPIGKTWIHLLGKWVGYWVHWTGKRTVPCLGKRCPKQRCQRPAYWVGYWPAALPIYGKDEGGKRTGWEKVIVQGNADVAAFLLQEDPTYPVRIHAHRGKMEKGWTPHTIDTVPAKNDLPAAFPIEPILYRVWGVRPGTDSTTGDEEKSARHSAQAVPLDLCKIEAVAFDYSE